MKIAIIFVFIVFFTTSTEDKDVYLCGPNGAKKYHFSETCRGLSNCKHEITKKKLSEAKNLGLTICGWED